MIDEAQLRRRFLADAVPQRLGQLSSTLCRLSDFITMNRAAPSVILVMDEGQRFVQWTKGDVEPEAATQLEELADDLRAWRGSWPQLIQNPHDITTLADEARTWSQRVLDMSGLLTGDS